MQLSRRAPYDSIAHSPVCRCGQRHPTLHAERALGSIVHAEECPPSPRATRRCGVHRAPLDQALTRPQIVRAAAH
eukprot:3402763-Prymnesium_polylepis.1